MSDSSDRGDQSLAESVSDRQRLAELERSNRQLRSRAEHLRVINEFAVDILQHQSLNEIIWSVAHNAIANLGFEDCVVYLLDDTGELLVQNAAFGPKNPSSREILSPLSIAVGHGIVGAVAATGRSELIQDTRLDPRYIQDDEPRKSELAVPIIHAGKVIGVIDSENSAAGYYDQSHVEILTTIASIASTSIARALSYSKLQETVGQLREAERLQATLHDIARLANSRRKLELFYEQLHEAIADVIYADNLYIAIYDDVDESFTFPYVTFSDEKGRPTTGSVWPRSRMEGGLTDYVVRSGKPLLTTPDTLAELATREQVAPLGRNPVSWLGVPLIRGRKVIGVLALQSYSEEHCFDEADRDVLHVVSQHVSMALEHRRIEAKLRWDAQRDSLTGLPNRSVLMGDLQSTIDAGNPNYSVLFLDLDRFKLINDSLGHQVGDRLLCEVGRRLEACVTDGALAARMGGDEFAVLLTSDARAAQARELADRIQAALEDGIVLDSRELFTSASIGIVAGDPRYTKADEILRDADAALYRAKAAGRRQWALFDESMLREAIDLLQLENDLRRAIQNDEFVIHYQPIVSLGERRIVGFEALARWQHPRRGLLIPHEFLQRAEDTGLVVKLDWCVVQKVSADVARWLEADPSLADSIRVSINLSSLHLHFERFSERLSAELDSRQVPGKCLVLEITEHALLDNLPHVSRQLRALRDLGLRISVDDFGTGYSSLSYLHQLPLDALKIDRTFIGRLAHDSGSQAIVRAILALAQALELQVVAEGIETDEQYAILSAMGCGLGQGYQISPAVDADTAIAMLEHGGRLPPATSLVER